MLLATETFRILDTETILCFVFLMFAFTEVLLLFNEELTLRLLDTDTTDAHLDARCPFS